MKQDQMIQKIKLRILNWFIRHLFNGVTEDDVLHMQGVRIYRDGRELQYEEKREIVTGARALKELPFWNFLMKEMKMSANRKMFEKSHDIYDIMFGKAVLWTIDVMEKKVDNLSRLPVKKQEKEKEE